MSAVTGQLKPSTTTVIQLKFDLPSLSTLTLHLPRACRCTLTLYKEVEQGCLKRMGSESGERDTLVFQCDFKNVGYYLFVRAELAEGRFTLAYFGEERCCFEEV
jgi:hypothetical protein